MSGSGVAVVHARPEPAGPTPVGEPPAAIGNFGRPLVAALLLLVCYFAAASFNSTRGYLGTDTGAKVATLQVMQSHHDFDPNAGYWAARDDPQGRLHPLYDTRHVGDRYVSVTTLPMLLLARPLWALGGMRLALLLPMLGGVAAAAAARVLAKRLGS